MLLKLGFETGFSFHDLFNQGQSGGGMWVRWPEPMTSRINSRRGILAPKTPDDFEKDGEPWTLFMQLLIHNPS